MAWLRLPGLEERLAGNSGIRGDGVCVRQAEKLHLHEGLHLCSICIPSRLIFSDFFKILRLRFASVINQYDILLSRLNLIKKCLFSPYIQVHSNNMFSRGVKIFSSVSCWFKPRLIAGWEVESVAFKTVLDDRNPSARYVTVPLNRRTAKSIRCRFYFADIWMMFSEISFQSGNKSTHTHVRTPVSHNREIK